MKDNVKEKDYPRGVKNVKKMRGGKYKKAIEIK
jgi:hypothetical protein